MRWRGVVGVLATMVATTAGLAATTAAPAGAAPANDGFATATAVTGTSIAVTGQTSAGATAEPGEPDHDMAAAPTASVWYRWTAPADGTASAYVASATFTSVLAAYEGAALGSLDVV